MKQAKFKTYIRNQLQLIPQSWEEKISQGYHVRIVENVIDKLDLSELYRTYKGGGTSSNHPYLPPFLLHPSRDTEALAAIILI